MSGDKDRVYTTSVIENLGVSDSAAFVNIEVANFDSRSRRIVSVEVFDWSNNIPIGLPIVSYNGPLFTLGGGTRIMIEPNTEAFFTAEIYDSIAYEVRITFHHTNKDIIANVFGEGPDLNRVLDVLHSQLRRIDLN